MASINQVLLLGNVGRDPDVRYLENQSKVAQFSLATTEYYKDRQGQRQENTEWHNIVAFGTFASVAENYLHKGSQVAIIGKLRTREYQDRNGQRKWTTEVVVQNLQLCGPRQDIQAAGIVNSVRQLNEQQRQYQAPQPSQQPAPQSLSQMAQQAPHPVDDGGDDLPF